MKWHPAGSNGNDGNYSITKGTSASLLGSQSDTGRQIQKADLGSEQLFLAVSCLSSRRTNPVGDGGGLKPGFPFCQWVHFPREHPQPSLV